MQGALHQGDDITANRELDFQQENRQQTQGSIAFFSFPREDRSTVLMLKASS